MMSVLRLARLASCEIYVNCPQRLVFAVGTLALAQIGETAQVDFCAHGDSAICNMVWLYLILSQQPATRHVVISRHDAYRNVPTAQLKNT